MKNVETIFLFFINLSSSYSIKINVDEFVKLKTPKILLKKKAQRWICKVNPSIYLIFSKKLKLKNK